jgi:hypothetical protein
MWSPTLLFDRRAYGPEKLSSVTQKDFCNTIGAKQTFANYRRRLSADFVAEIGIPPARDGWCIFLKPSIVTRWIVRATYARLY